MRLRTLGAVLILVAPAAACGVETAIDSAVGDEHVAPPPAPALRITGRALTPRMPTLTVLDGAGAPLALSESTVRTDGTFTARLPGEAELTNLRVVATADGVVLKKLLPRVRPGTAVDAGLVDELSTTATLLVEARVALAGLAFGGQSPSVLAQTAADLVARIDAEESPFIEVQRAVERIVQSGALRAPAFGVARADGAGGLTGALDPLALPPGGLDYDGDDTPDVDATRFHALLAAAAAAFELSACYHPTLLRVVLAVDLREGRLDGNCAPIDRFRWVDPSGGDTAWFTGGVHPDNALALDATVRTQLHQALGGWVPNKLRMYDDATHGDEAAGDGVHTIAFELPRGLRIGYKFTWGAEGENWGGTEEWPGNQRILEVQDVNGDHYVSRWDAFGDEATNKDKMNGLRPASGGRGTIDFTTDADGDGTPDARERPLDADNDCQADGWWTPRTLAPVTVDCP